MDAHVSAYYRHLINVPLWREVAEFLNSDPRPLAAGVVAPARRSVARLGVNLLRRVRGWVANCALREGFSGV